MISRWMAVALLWPAMVTAVPAQEGAPPAVIDEATLAGWLHPEPYAYGSIGMRDPFATLLSREGEELTGDPGVADLTIVGVLWGARGRFALAETRQGECLLLRVGDRLRDGRILSITPEGITVVQYYFGMSRRVNLPIFSGEEGGHEER